MEIKTLEFSQLFLLIQLILYYLVCIDLNSHLRDAVLMTSLHDVMSTRVDNSGLPKLQTVVRGTTAYTDP